MDNYYIPPPRRPGLLYDEGMKIFLLLLLVLMVSCQPRSSKSGRKTPVRHQPESAVSEERDAEDVVIVHEEKQEEEEDQPFSQLTPVVEIDTQNKHITITGNSGEFCGLEFFVGNVLEYKLLTPSRLEMKRDGKSIFFNRINIKDQNDLFGDWLTTIETDGSKANVIFYIRKNPVMVVDVTCGRTNP